MVTRDLTSKFLLLRENKKLMISKGIDDPENEIMVEIDIEFEKLVNQTESSINELNKIYSNVFYENIPEYVAKEKTLLTKLTKMNKLAAGYMNLIQKKYDGCLNSISKQIWHNIKIKYKMKLQNINKLIIVAKKKHDDISDCDDVSIGKHQNQNMQMLEEKSVARATAINKLCQDINDLAQLNQQLNDMIVEQGTVIDRIDYNIDIAHHNVVKGKDHVVAANKHSKSSSGKNKIILGLISGIAGLATVIGIKKAH